MANPHTYLRNLVLALGALACGVPAGAALASPLNWFSGDTVQGNGHIIKQSRELAHFNGLASSVPGNIEIRLGNTESVTIETDDNLQPLIETVVDNGTLRIRPAKKDLRLETHTMKIVVQARSVERIAVAGSGSVEAAQLSGDKLQLDIGGSGSINVQRVDSAAMAISLGGSGNLKASGHTGHLHVSLGGSGRVQAGQLVARDADISIGGSGQATVAARDQLNVSVAGSGDVGYYGDPQLTRSVMGSGSVKRLGAMPQ